MAVIKKKKINEFCALFIIISSLFSCTSKPLHDDATTDIKPISTNETVTIVAVGIVKNKNFEYLIQSNGKIKSLHEQVISNESGGKLLVNNAKTGKEFSIESLILQLETTAIQFRLQKAKLAQFNSQKEYESQLLGYENLLKDKTKEQGEDIKQKLKISTGLAAAEQEIKEANYELTKAYIKAPFSGIVADVKVQQGQTIKPGEALFKIYDPYNLLLEVNVLEADIPMLRQGTPAEVAPVANPELIYKASVYEINPYVDVNGMVSVKLKVTSPPLKKNEKLFPGMNCTAIIRVPFAKTLVVPKEAVVMRNGKAVVFTIEDGNAKWNYVIIGKDNGKEIEIKEGVKQGQKIVLTNNLQLGHDAPVKEEDIQNGIK